jgi:hypothetical protein
VRTYASRAPDRICAGRRLGVNRGGAFSRFPKGAAGLCASVRPCRPSSLRSFGRVVADRRSRVRFARRRYRYESRVRRSPKRLRAFGEVRPNMPEIFARSQGFRMRGAKGIRRAAALDPRLRGNDKIRSFWIGNRSRRLKPLSREPAPAVAPRSVWARRGIHAATAKIPRECAA